MKTKAAHHLLALGLALTCGGATAGSPFGPVNNPEDQWRGCSGSSKHFAEFAAAGFNTVTGAGLERSWQFARGSTYLDVTNRWRRAAATCADASAHGLGLFPNYGYCYNYGNRNEYALIHIDGTTNSQHHIDGLNPQYRRELERALIADGQGLRGLAAINGIITASEMRDWDGPSYTAVLTNAYRAATGREVPPASAICSGTSSGWAYRNPVPWQKVKDFPKDRIVPDDWPVLDFYKWIWREGDGWPGALDLIAETFCREIGREVSTEFDPVLRIPSIWGTLGPRVNMLESWMYTTPEPFNILYFISQLQAVRRERPERAVFVGIQAIMYRSNTSPKKVLPQNPPAWLKEFPNAGYITTAPDIMQEALWHAFSRQVDGFELHDETSLMDIHPHDKDGYQCTEPETLRRVGKIFAETAIPLGPLFRAIPERAPEVAVLESAAAQILGGHIEFAPHMYFFNTMFVADAANLATYVMYEDEVKARGIPPSVKAIILPKCDVLTRSTYDALVAFQKRGGRLVGDRMLLPAIKPDATYVSFEEEEKNTHGDYDDGKQSRFMNSEKRQRSVFAAAKNLRAAVGLSPYADSDKPDILVHARSYGKADYVFAVNDRRTAGDYIGQWGLVLEKGLPNAGTVTVRRTAGAVYDLVKHASVAFTVKDGVTSIPVSYDTNDGRVFLVVDAPLKPLTFSLDGTKLTVRSPDKDAMLPIRIDGFGSKPWYAVVKDGVWTRDFGAAPRGLRVTSLADDTSAGYAPKNF